MQNDFWYSSVPYMGPFQYVYHTAPYPYGGMQPYYNLYNESAELTDEAGRNIQDVNRVMTILRTQHQHLYQELARHGMDIRLINYLFFSIVSFVDETYDRYTGTLEQKITQAERALRRRNPWIFDIMNVYAVSPASQARIVNMVLRVSFQNLRHFPAPMPPPHPTPR